MTERLVTLWLCARCGNYWEAPRAPGPLSERRPDCPLCGTPALWRGEKVAK